MLSPESPTFIRDKKLKQIPLTKGRFALVDDEDYEVLSAFKWHVNSNGYALRSTRLNGVKRDIRMHRLLMGLAPDDDRLVDHIDGDPLNNQRANLRLATWSQNCRNRKMQSNNSSGFKGVRWHSKDLRWVAQIVVAGRRKHLGNFRTREEAHAAYCKAAVELYGEFANFGEKKAA